MKTIKEFFISPPRTKPKEPQESTSDMGTSENEGSKVCNGHGGSDPQETEHLKTTTTKNLVCPASKPLHNSKCELTSDCTVEHSVSDKSDSVSETASRDQQTVSQVIQRESSLTLKKKHSKKEDAKPALCLKVATPTEHCDKKLHESASSSVNYADFLKSVEDDADKDNETMKDSLEKDVLENGMMEMSYEAFLNDSGTTNDENIETDCKQKVDGTRASATKSLDNFPDNPGAKTLKQNQGDKEEDGTEDPKPAKKPRGNIMNYFSKTTNPEDRMISSSTKMKVSALVHPSPSKYADTSHLNHSRKSSSEGEVVKSNVVADNCEVELLSITHLDSQIINVPVRRKRKIRSAKNVSQEKTPDESMPKSDPCENNQILENVKSTNLEIQKSLSTFDGDSDMPQDKSKDSPVSIETVSVRTEEPKDNTLSIGSTDDEVQLLEDTGTPNEVFSVPSKDTKKTQQCILKFNKRGGLGLGTAPKQTESQTTPPAEVTQEESCKKHEQADDVLVTEIKPGRCKTLKRNTLKQKPNTRAKTDSSEKQQGKVADGKLRSAKPASENKDTTTVIESSGESNNELNDSFSVTMCGKKSKPLVLRFTRLRHLAQNTEEQQVKQVKLSRAQQLLQRARGSSKKKPPSRKDKSTTKPDKSKPKKPERSMDSSSDFTSPPTRRSSRNSSKVASLAIAMCYEGNTTGVTQMESTPKKPGKAKRAIEVLTETPVKSPAKTPAKSAKKAAKRSPRKPAKSAVKLAPIFMQAGKKKTNVPASPVKETPQRPLTAAEIEAQRIRRQFLTSGLPEAVQRQASIEAAVGVADYPPIPAISHVFQRPIEDSSGLNVWKLPDVALKLQSEKEAENFKEKSANLAITPGLLTQSLAKLPQCQPKELKTEKPSITPEVEQLLLAEIHTVNPSFPVRRTYKQLTRHRNAAGQNEKSTTSCNVAEDPAKTASTEGSNKETGSKKRKHAEVQEDSDSQPARTKRLRRSGRKSAAIIDSDTALSTGGCTSQEENSPEQKADDKSKLKLPSPPDGEAGCQEMLWTEKYQPQQATEILGNSGVVRKIKAWLIEWKHRLDAEMKRQRKLQLLQAKREGKSLEEIRKKLGLDCWTDDGSDFALSDENEDDSDCGEDDNLCNTVLLTGPSGCGKTAAVYALAKELGYKVFEVNASSKRNGRQVLAQLQEATQSHQVAKKKQDPPGLPVSSGGLLSTAKDCQAGVAKPEKKPMPAAFANFFTKKAPAAEPAKKANNSTEKKGKTSEEGVKKPKGKGKRRQDSGEVIFLEEQQSPVKKKSAPSKKKSPKPPQVGGTGTSTANQEGLNLCSMSLILFEDVDVVFEEDRGLWAAIDTFMQSTKVPIILTTNDCHLLDRLRISSRVDQFSMRQPHLTSLAAYLQLVCLTEKMRTRYPHLLSLVEFCRGDIRQSLLMLQFFGESGGSGQTRESPISYSARFLKSETANLGTELKVVAKIEDPVIDSKLKSVLPTFGSSAADDAQSEDEFVVHKKRSRLLHKAIPIICDESSMDSLPRTPQKIQHVSSLQTADSQTEDNCPSSQQSVDERAFGDGNSSDLVTVASTETMTFPCIQDTLFEDATCLATELRKHRCSPFLSEVMKLADRNSSSLAGTLRYFRQSGFDLLMANLPFLLPLPISTQPPLPPSPLRSSKSRWSRIQCRSSLWEDSDDDSSSGFLSLAKESKKQEDSLCGTKATSVRRAATEGDRLVQKALFDISDFYSDLSLIDTLHAGDDLLCERGQGLRVGQTWKQGGLAAGQDDHLGTVSPGDDVIKSKVDVVTEVVSSAEALSLELCRSKLTSTLEKVDALEGQDQALTRESMSVYLGRSCDRVHLFRESTSEQRLASQRSRAITNVCSQLPACVQCQRRSVVLDYVPGIRAVCQLEECRKAYGNKRRFFHHLTSMMCGLKTSTVDTLVSSFK